MSETDITDLTVIGMGALGRTLLKALYLKKGSVRSVYSRDQHKARRWADEVEAGFSGTFPDEQKELGEIIFICVSDDIIEQIAQKFAESKLDISNKLFVHCSGTKPASVMQALSSKGAKIASFHPLQTFTKEWDPERFSGITISLQGDENAIPVLEAIAKNLGANSVQITESDKIKLHIAAVVTCNYLVTLADAASVLLEYTSMDKTDSEKLQMLFPLMEQTFQNIKMNGPGESLSGPIKRGDIKTIQDHLKNMKDLPDIGKVYACLGSYTADRLLKQHKMSEYTHYQMKQLFDKRNNKPDE